MFSLFVLAFLIESVGRMPNKQPGPSSRLIVWPENKAKCDIPHILVLWMSVVMLVINQKQK